MSTKYTSPIVDALKTVGNARNTGTVFASESEVTVIRSAVGYGLLRFVPLNHNPFQFHDNERNEKFGIELTSMGMQFLGIDESKYHTK